ncbi:MAG: sensor histidine kinase [Steroidobacteraceae bacterium]
MSGMWILALASAGLAATAAAQWRGRARLRSAELAQRAATEQQRIAAHAELERARAVAAERERIFRDLHDDLGARLLELVYSAPTPEYADRARGVLQQMRRTVAESRRPPALLHDLLDEVRDEARNRLQGTGIELHWEQDAALPNVMIDQGRLLHVLRIVREAISNALKHGQPHRLRMRIFSVADHMLLDVTDDGAFAPDAAGTGTGTTVMQERAAEMGAAISWRAGTWGGTKVALRMPLEPAPGVEST